MALGDMDRHFAWQAWHLWHWAGSGGALGFRPGAGDAATVGVAAVALGDIHLRFTWQAWYLVTSTSTLRGRRGTYGTGLALVARLETSTFVSRGRRGMWTHSLSTVSRVNFAWQAWHFVTSTITLCGRRGTWRHVAALCVAGVALGTHTTYSRRRGTWRKDRHFAWQAWHVWHWAGSGGALGSHVPPWSPRLFAWQAWHLATCSCTMCGRRGTLRHPPSFHVTIGLSWIFVKLSRRANLHSATNSSSKVLSVLPYLLATSRTFGCDS